MSDVAGHMNRLFQLYLRNSKPETLRAYVGEFANVNPNELGRAIDNLVRDWDKVSLPPVGEIHKRLGTREASDNGRGLSVGECRGMIIRRIESRGRTATDDHIRAEWNQFAEQLGWPPIEPGWVISGEASHRFTPQEESTGSEVLKLARAGVFWCHAQLGYFKAEFVQCTTWPQSKCNRAIQPSPKETREAFALHVKGEAPNPRRVPMRGLEPIGDALREMF